MICNGSLISGEVLTQHIVYTMVPTELSSGLIFGGESYPILTVYHQLFSVVIHKMASLSHVYSEDDFTMEG